MRINFLLLIFLIGLSLPSYSQTADFDFTEVCLGDTTLLTNTSTSPTDPIVNVSWDLDNDLQFDDASGNEIKFKFSTAGVKRIGLRIITEGGSSQAIYQDVLVGSFPNANFTFDNACSNDFTKFTNTSTIGDDEDLEDFLWSFGDGRTNDYETSPSHWYSSPGIYSVELIAISFLGCRDTITKPIDVQPVPTFSLEFVGDTIFTEGGSVTVNAVGEFDNIVWSTGATTESITITQGGSYSAEIKKGGCPSTKTFTIVVNDREGVATIITPNGDGFNDTWKIFHINNHTPCKVSVFTRDGKEVFSSNNYNNDWGGTYQGKPLPEGTYYYVLSCESGLVRKGALNIIR